jgi:hypothetical protein
MSRSNAELVHLAEGAALCSNFGRQSIEGFAEPAAIFELKQRFAPREWVAPASRSPSIAFSPPRRRARLGTVLRPFA